MAAGSLRETGKNVPEPAPASNHDTDVTHRMAGNLLQFRLYPVGGDEIDPGNRPTIGQEFFKH
jgi:hypothetical protein